MEQKIDIAELLKGAPKQYDLYSPIFGAVQLVGVEEECGIITVEVFDDDPPGEEHSWEEKFDHYGRYYTAYSINADAECMLLPKDSTWENFKAPWLHKSFEVYDKVIVKAANNRWRAALYSHYVANIHRHMIITGETFKEECILPYESNKDLLGKTI